MDSYLKVSNGVLKQLSEEKEPLEIYHYTSPVGFNGIIQNKHLWFSDRFCLNDYSEGNYVLNLFMTYIDLILSDLPLKKKKDEIINRCTDYIREFPLSNMNIYQLSFSLDDDSLCMWNYYTKGDSIQGYNLHFNSKELCDSLYNLYSIGKKPYPSLLRGTIDYDEDSQINKVKCFISKIYKAIFEDCNSIENTAIQTFINRIDSIFERLTLIGTFFKSNCFSIEKEYRIAIDLFVDDGEAIALKEDNKDGKISNKQCKFSFNHSFFVPHFELEFDPKVLKEIKLSPTLDYVKMKNNLDFLLYNKGFRSTEITESKIPVRY